MTVRRPEHPRNFDHPSHDQARDDVRLILIAGVEGGGVTLYGQKQAVGWRFRTSYADQTPLMLDEPEIRHESGWLENWEEALAELDRQGWQRLPAVMVHPEFRARVWAAIESRLRAETDQPERAARLLASWRFRCEIDP